MSMMKSGYVCRKRIAKKLETNLNGVGVMVETELGQKGVTN